MLQFTVFRLRLILPLRAKQQTKQLLFFNLLASTTVERNIAMGMRALYANSTENSNVAIGYYALGANRQRQFDLHPRQIYSSTISFFTL